MTDDRVVTAKLPGELVSRMDVIAARMERTKSWIVKQAVAEWVADEEWRHQLTLEGLKSADEGRTMSHEEALAHFERRKSERAERSK